METVHPRIDHLALPASPYLTMHNTARRSDTVNWIVVTQGLAP